MGLHADARPGDCARRDATGAPSRWSTLARGLEHGARNPWVSTGGRILLELGLAEPPERDEPGMFVLADEERLRALLEGAGFLVETVEDVPVVFEFAGVDDYIARTVDTGGMFARMWHEASDEEREVVRARLAEEFVPFAATGGYALPGVSVVVAAS